MRWFKLSVMDRYLVKELALPFLFSVAMFTSVGVAIGTLSDLMYKIFEYDLAWFLALKVMLLKVPEYVSYALPVSVLLTTLITYSRLSKDNELIALRSSGISLYRLITPALMLSFLITIISFAFNELILPAANFEATSILVENLNEDRQFLLRKDIFYPEYQDVKANNGNSFKQLKTLFYAKRFDGKNMRNLTVVTQSESGLNNIITSEKAAWNSQDKVWDFFKGVMYSIDSDNPYPKSLTFEKKQLKISKMPLELAIQSRDPYEMNISQAQQYLKLLRLLGDEKTILMFEVRTAQKFAFPFVCIIFSLVGSSLGSRPNYNSKATSFGLSVAIVFLYYLSSFIISSLGLIGILTPFMAAWIPNFLGLGIGIYLLVKVNDSIIN